jgi:hypothetical protein
MKFQNILDAFEYSKVDKWKTKLKLKLKNNYIYIYTAERFTSVIKINIHKLTIAKRLYLDPTKD